MHKRKGDLFICTKVERQAFEWIQIAFREEKKQEGERRDLCIKRNLVAVSASPRECIPFGHATSRK